MMRCSSHRKGEALAGAPLDNAPKEYPPKIQQLVQDIASLTLLEISDLNELLKVLARRPTSWPLCGGWGAPRDCACCDQAHPVWRLLLRVLFSVLQKTLKIQDVGFMPMGAVAPGAPPAAAAPEVSAGRACRA